MSAEGQDRSGGAIVSDELRARLDSLGLLELADKYELERTERKLLAVRAEADQIALQEHLAELREQRDWASQTAAHAQMFDEIARYSNVVLTLGYAGIFAIWTFVKQDISPFWNYVVAYSTGLSLLIFIGWTLYNTAYLMNLKTNLQAVHAEEHDTLAKKHECLDDAKAENDRKKIALLKPYPFVYWTSTVSGIFSGVTLLIVLIRKIIAG